jgi:peptidoglycan hydrolase-like protein with peptidoglycan-binding domain
MHLKKKLLVASALGMAVTISGCTTIPIEYIEYHDRVMASQRADFEQKLESLAAENSATEAKNKQLIAKNSSVESKDTELEILAAENSVTEAENTQLIATNSSVESKDTELEIIAVENSVTEAENTQLIAKNSTVEPKNTTLEMAKESADSNVTQLQAVQTSGSINTPDTSNQLFPPNAQLGHCYSRVLTPAEYKTTITKEMVKAESKSITIIPAEYENGSKRVLVKEAGTKLVVTPATYKNVTEEVEVSPAHTHLETVPAVYETLTERVIDQPAHTAWKRGTGFQSSALETKIDNGTGEVMCLVEVPATYRTITKTILKSAVQVTKVSHPAVYKTISKRVLDKKATTRSVGTTPAQYKTVAIKRITSPEKQVATKINAVYKNVSSTEQVSAEVLNWAEVLCENNMTSQTVLGLQKLLKKSGSYRGPLDGIYGPMTERAANGYAKANGLPTGSRLISLETAKHIGLEI